MVTKGHKISSSSQTEEALPTLWLFKLFNSIKDEHEVTFAELELRSLVGEVERVRNFFDLIQETPLQHFCGDEYRIQDIVTFEPAYGKYQGFSFWSEKKEPNLGDLVKRLAYTREIFVVQEGSDAAASSKRLFPNGVSGKNLTAYASEGYVLIRAVTNQYFLEKSSYISKLSRHEDDVNKNVDTLLSYPFHAMYRVPASSTMAVGKRLEDYFAIREEPSLYLTHIWHPYKAKFHAKMARALLNYVCPEDGSMAMDNWSGSGTLNVEATLMGLENVGLEVNPLSALMSDVKCQALALSPMEFKKLFSSFLEELQDGISSFAAGPSVTTLLEFGGGGSTTAERSEQMGSIKKEAEQLATELKGLFTHEQVQEFLIARNLINSRYESLSRLILLLALSGSISDLARRRKGRLVEVMTFRLYKLMYLRLYLFDRLNQTLGIDLARSRTLVGDNRDLESFRTLNGKKEAVKAGSIDGIVTSPPYSTAVDYIRNDYPQLATLKLVDNRSDLEALERSMEGNPKPRVYRDPTLVRESGGDSPFHRILPEPAKSSIRKLREAGREAEAVRSFKFFKDMYFSLIAMNRALRVGAKAAVVIGNNHYKIDEETIEEVENDRIMLDLALRKEVGFAKDKLTNGLIKRPLEKTQAGLIRNESVLVIVKEKDATFAIG